MIPQKKIEDLIIRLKMVGGEFHPNDLNYAGDAYRIGVHGKVDEFTAQYFYEEAIKGAKKLLREGITNSFDTVLEMSANMQALMHLTEDHQEALSAFFEKRDGNFKGK